MGVKLAEKYLPNLPLSINATNNRPAQIQVSNPLVCGSLVTEVEEATPIKTEEEAEDTLLSEVAESILHDQEIFVEAHKCLPKFVGNSSTRIFPSDWCQKTLVKLKAKASDSSTVVPGFKLLEIFLSDLPNDPYSILLIAKGRSDKIQKLQEEIQKHIQKEEVTYNLSMLLKDRSSIELDIKLDCSSTDSIIGITCNSPITPPIQPGVWIWKVTPNSQMHHVIKNSADKGAAIILVHGIKVYKVSDVTDAWAKAKSSGIMTALVKVCFSKDANFSDVDTSKILNPYRRDASVYQGPFTLSPPTVLGQVKSAVLEVSSQRKRKHAEVNHADVPQKKRNSDTVDHADAPHMNEMIDTVELADTAAGRKKSSFESGKKKIASYQHLIEKYHVIREIEYKSHGINGQSVNKKMWDRHKLIYGEECNDHCLCPSDLPRLTEEIVPEFLEKMKKRDREWTNPQGLCADESPVGVVSNFVPKFYDQVQKEFPGDSPAQTLKKLLGMWNKHKGVARFGHRCKKVCPCLEGWDTVFKKFLHPPKNIDRKVASAAPLLRQNPVNKMNVPLKKTQPKSNGDVRKMPGLLLQKMATQSPELGDKKEISILFSVLEPLGFCLVSDSTTCKVSSINPFADKTDPRLHVGTVVVGSSPWSIISPSVKCAPLCTYTELKNRYEAIKMKKDNSKIKLWFTNSFATPIESDRAECAAEWTKSGAWQGPLNKCWPGGAPIAQKVNTKPQQEQGRPSDRQQLAASVRENMRRINQSGQNSSVNRLVPSTRHTNGEQGSTIMKTSVIKQEGVSAKRASLAQQILRNQDKLPPNKASEAGQKLATSMSYETQGLESPGVVTSILRSTSFGKKPGAMRTRRLSWKNDLTEIRTYIKDGMVDQGGSDKTTVSTDRVINEPISEKDSDKAASVDMDISIQQKLSDELTKGILEKDYTEVIRILQSGANAKLKDSHKKIPRQYTKENLGKITKELECAKGEYREKLKESQKEFRLKDTVLKIYLQAEHLVNMARHLGEWTNVELAPLQARDLQLTDIGMYHPASDFIFALVNLDGRAQEPSMPLIPFSKMADWTQVPGCPKFTLGFNEKLEFSYKLERKVKVELIKGSSKDPGNNIKLGSWEETVEKIKDALASSGEAELEHEIRNSEYLLDGSMTVKVTKRKPDSEFFRRKRIEVARELSNLADWILNFQKETRFVDGKHSLDANISLPTSGGLSILHAAVYVADLNLVYRLLTLGADSSSTSTEAGSAENLAVNLADRNISSQNTENYGTLIDIMNALKKDAASRRGKNVSTPGSQSELASKVRSILKDKSIVGMNHSKEPEAPPVLMSQQAKSGQHPQAMQQINTPQQPWASAGYQPAPPMTGYQQNHGHQQQYGYAVPNQTYNHPSQMPFQAFPGQYPQAINSPAMTNLAQIRQGHMPGPSNSSGVDHMEHLPKLYSVDWVPGHMIRCKQFNRLGGCLNGPSCLSAHIHAPMGIELDNSLWVDHAVVGYNGNLWSVQNIHIKTEMSPTHKKWYTAAYIDPRTNVIYYSERGTNARLSDQGIYWYPNEGNAVISTKRVLLHALQVSCPNRLSEPPTNLPTPPPTLRPSLDDPRIRVEDRRIRNAQAHDYTYAHWNIFNKLKRADTQAIYTKIFPGNILKRTVWKSKRSKIGEVTTIFQSPAEEDNGSLYYPIECKGTFKEGIWWYSEEKFAKLSAFLQFLISAAKRGLVRKDLTETIDGKRFFK